MNKLQLLFLIICFFSIQLSAQKKSKEEEKGEIFSTISLDELIQTKSSHYVITNENVSRISGIRNVYLRQAINGIEVKGTESSVHIDQNGKTVVQHNKFVDNIQSTVKSSISNAKGSISNLNSQQAIEQVASQMGYIVSDLQKTKNLGGLKKQVVYNKAGISLVDIPVKLIYYYQKDKGTHLVWELSIAETTSTDWWNFRVDASTGKIIDKDNWTRSCNILGDACKRNHGRENESEDYLFYTVEEEPTTLVGSYRVYAMPIESPLFGGRTLEVDPHNTTASPFGWHDTNGVAGAEFTDTRGNNVDAHKGTDRPSGGESLIFDFPINEGGENPATNTPPYITNLFYWNNIVHDVIYQYGFDEVSGNFQENNYGNGGVGSDSVNANAQASGNCNAQFGTPSDGYNPTMNMFLCDYVNPSHDGDLDSGIIIHEYAHGISTRLTGGPNNIDCLANLEQMGEGWSDYYGLMLTMETGDAGTDSRNIANYLVGQPANGSGIRRMPYSTNFAINDYTYINIKLATIPHGVGEVWATMLWEMTWELIGDHGFDPDFYNFTGNVANDAGNIQSLAIVTEAMKLQPCSPGFVDGRDAILQADRNIYDGANQCTIWEAFARRGLGFSALQGSSNNTVDGTEAFDLPPSFASFDTIDELCLASGTQTGLSGGSPTGGVYSGTGVVDDGNGMTYTLTPTALGNVTVTYVVDVACSGETANLIDIINITNNVPEVICRGPNTIPQNDSESVSPNTAIPDNNTITSTLTITDNVNISDLNLNINITHGWVGDVIVSLQSPSGTSVTLIDRPLFVNSGFGCSGSDILVTLDDEAMNPIEDQCTNNIPTINGSFTPNNPLSAFDGESTMGVWTLSVTDSASLFEGTLVNWGIDYEYQIPLLRNGSESVISGKTIQDNRTITSTLAITDNVTILDLNMTIDIIHNWVGHVTVSLQSPSGTSVTLIDRPGYVDSGGFSGFGCLGDNILATLDDEAMNPIEDECANNIPTINGSFTPNNPLSAFDGESTMGIWTLYVADSASSFEGTLVSWGIDYEYHISSPPLDVVLDETGNTTINVSDLILSATVGCGSVTSTAGSPASTTISFDCNDIGSNSVIVTVTDDVGSSTSCTALVNVSTGARGVSISCPSNISVNTDSGVCGAVANYTAPVGTSPCSSVSTIQTAGLASGSTFPIGTTTNTYKVDDGNGDTDTCSFTVTVIDNEAPIINCPGNATVTGNTNCEAVLGDYTTSATSSDNCSAPTVSQSPAIGTTIGGTQTVTLTATDGEGLTATCTFTVTIEDTTPPTISCPTDETVTTLVGTGYTLPDYWADGDATASDDCTASVTNVTQSPTAGTTLTIGTHTISFTAEDDAGNDVSCTFELTVDELLGIEDNNIDIANIILAPNPANQFIRISNSQQIEIEKVVVYDITGRVVKVFNEAVVNTENTLNVSQLPSASYVLIIYTPYGKVIKHLIIIKQ